MKRFIWVTPAINGAIGGIKVILDFNRFLNELGYNSQILHFLPRGDHRRGADYTRLHGYPFHIDFFGHPEYVNADAVHQDDVLIFTEPDLEGLVTFRDHPNKVVFVQNWHGVQEHVLLNGIRSYSDIGVTKILAISEYIKKFIKWGMKPLEHKIEVVKYFVDSEKFYPGDWKEKDVPGVLIGHKHIVNEAIFHGQQATIHRHDLSELIPRLFKEREIKANFSTLSGVKHDRVGDLMRKNDIYVHCGVEEGYPTPVVEAKLCGLLTVGFSGKSYCKELDFPVQDGDIPALCDKLNTIINDRIYNRKKENETIDYSRETSKKSLQAAFKNLNLIK